LNLLYWAFIKDNINSISLKKKGAMVNLGAIDKNQV
jgi:hypothetical protein